MKRMDIMDRKGERLYLTRYWLLGHRVSKWALMLHRMHLPDDACHHDHPWWFITMILRGGYTEEISRPDGSVVTRKNRPGMILFRKAEHTHCIKELSPNGCTTLVLRGARSRSWGFHTPSGWVWWSTFLNISRQSVAAWCSEDAPSRYADSRTEEFFPPPRFTPNG